MAYSMTGFGAAEGAVGQGILRIELKSVNHRYLSLSLKAPSELVAMEHEIRERLRRDFERGHFSVSVRWLEMPGRLSGPRVDPVGTAAAMDRLRELAVAAGVEPTISLELLSRQSEVFTSADPAAAVEWSAVEAVLAQAIDECRETRRREGGVLSAELTLRLSLIRGHAAQAAELAPARLIRERDRLRTQVAQLLEGRTVDEGRLSQE